MPVNPFSELAFCLEQELAFLAPQYPIINSTNPNPSLPYFDLVLGYSSIQNELQCLRVSFYLELKHEESKSQEQKAHENMLFYLRLRTFKRFSYRGLDLAIHLANIGVGSAQTYGSKERWNIAFVFDEQQTSILTSWLQYQIPAPEINGLAYYSDEGLPALKIIKPKRKRGRPRGSKNKPKPIAST